MNKDYMDIPVVKKMAGAMEVGWANPKLRPWREAKDALPVTAADITDAEERLDRKSVV